MRVFAHTPVAPLRSTVATRRRAVELLCARTPRPNCGCRQPRRALRPSSPHGSIYSPLHYSPSPPRSSFDWKRRREEKVTAEAEESTAFAPVGGTRRTGAYSPKCLQSEGNAPSHGHVPSLHFSTLLCGQCSARDSSRFRRIRDAPAFPPAAESCAGRFRWHCTVWPPPRRLSCRCGSACPQPHPGSALGLSRRFSIH